MFWIDTEYFDRESPPATEVREGWDRFGFLPSNIACHFEGGAIAPVSNFDAVSNWVQKHLRFDNPLAQPNGGFVPGTLFPPRSWRELQDPGNPDQVEVVPGSAGIALLQRVASSHYLRLDDAVDPVAKREGAAGFIIKLVGFMYDAPTQFWDWWFDGPVSIGRGIRTPPKVFADFVSIAFANWREWDPASQQGMISALNMHSRAPAHGWYWERFCWEYAVTDACFRIAKTVWPERIRLYGKGLKHSDRIPIMCREFGLQFDREEAEWAKYAVDLRNELIHEARWCGAQPSSNAPDDSAQAPYRLHKLNQRLIVALLGYKNDFASSGWLSPGRATFSRPA